MLYLCPETENVFSSLLELRKGEKISGSGEERVEENKRAKEREREMCTGKWDKCRVCWCDDMPYFLANTSVIWRGGFQLMWRVIAIFQHRFSGDFM